MARKHTFRGTKKNVFVKPNEQHRACSDIVMTRIGNRQHGALGEMERQNALFKELEKNVFVKPNEQGRACSNVVMTRIGNRQHGALGEVERQNALFKERKRTINSRHFGRYKWACSGTTKGLYRHYKHLVAWLQTACSPTTNGIVQTICQQEVGKRVGKTDF